MHATTLFNYLHIAFCKIHIDRNNQEQKFAFRLSVSWDFLSHNYFCLRNLNESETGGLSCGAEDGIWNLARHPRTKW